jgi:hypothetical protein
MGGALLADPIRLLTGIITTSISMSTRGSVLPVDVN